MADSFKSTHFSFVRKERNHCSYMQSFYDHEANTVDGTTGFNYNRSTSLYILEISARWCRQRECKNRPIWKKEKLSLFPTYNVYGAIGFAHFSPLDLARILKLLILSDARGAWQLKRLGPGKRTRALWDVWKMRRVKGKSYRSISKPLWDVIHWKKKEKK